MTAGTLGAPVMTFGAVLSDAVNLSDASVLRFTVGSDSLRSEGNPVEIGDAKESVFWTASPGGIVVDTDAAFNGRGYWRSVERRGICAADVADRVEAVFEFKSFPVAAVGAFMNYTTDWPNAPTGVWMEALAADGSVLESYNLFTEAPIPGDAYIDNGAFRGIVRQQNDIAGFRVRSDGGYFALDDLTFSRLNLGQASNVSCRAKIANGGLLIPGFVITDQPAKVLVRVVGPGLAQLDVDDVMPDPQLRLYQGGVVIAVNGDWESPQTGVPAATDEVFRIVGAFPLEAGSKDAALVMQLLPGVYTVHAGSQDGTASGEILVEVYVVP